MSERATTEKKAPGIEISAPFALEASASLPEAYPPLSIPELSYYKIRAARAEMQLALTQAKQLEIAFTTLVQQELFRLIPEGHSLDDYTLNLETRTIVLRSALEVSWGT